MKKLILPILILCFITSCSKDESSVLTPNDIIGTWEETVVIEYKNNEEPYEEWLEPGENIYVITDKTITVFEEEMLFNGQPLAYTYSPKDGEMVYLGFLITVEFKSRDELILKSEKADGHTELHLRRID